MADPEGRKDLFYVLSRYWPEEVKRSYLNT
jgi:hypothetical protein